MFAAIQKLLRPRPKPAPYSIHDASLGIVREAQQRETIRALSNIIEDYDAREQARLRESLERDAELTEMLAMRGTGPWRMPGAAAVQESLKDSDEADYSLREAGTMPYIAQGAYGDAELMLNNIEWKRETSLSWLEFTRWGIQQIILIARLRCLKDPMLKRGMKVSAQYVFGRGVEITSEDKRAAKVLHDWRQRNMATLGHSALAECHRAKYYDGNIFWCCFTDALNSGDVTMRTIDAVEIMDVVTNPDDTSEPWYYKRDWVQQQFVDGVRTNVHMQAWYPALNYEPTGAERLEKIGGIPVNWDEPIYHRKAGDAPGKWHFGLPEVYAALEWGQAVKRFLQDCMTIRNSLAQFSMILQTKGGQQALQGIKTQLSTTVGPNASLWDQNPPTVTGGIFASGPGTTLQAFASKGAGGDPDDVRMYKLMVCMVFGIPESFFADMNTSNLATATSLDRPTQLNFMEQQEVWREDLTTLATYALRKSLRATSGKLREALRDLKTMSEAQISDAPVPDVVVTFPAIIEADVPARVNAIVQATTFGSKLGQAVGIDERVAVGELYKELGIENAQEVLEEQYPESEYDPDRTKEPAPSPLNPGSIAGMPAAVPGAIPGAPPNPQQQAAKTAEALRRAVERLGKSIQLWEAKISDSDE